MTSAPAIVTYFRGQGPNSSAPWIGSTLLSDHTAQLPTATNDFRMGPTEDENMTFFPFMANTSNGPILWALDAFTHRWECDDFRSGAEAATLHQIWAR